MYEPALLRPLAVFVSVVEQQSFRRAAEQLGISAPLASQIVSGLEESLGQQLLYRSTRKLVTTTAGSQLFRALRPSFDEIGRAVDELKGKTALPRGRLRVTMPTILATSALASFVAAYARNNPALQLELDFSDERRDPIEAGFDLAIRIGNADSGDRVRRLLFATEGVLCASEASTYRTPHTLEEKLYIRPLSLPDTIVLQQGQRRVRVRPARQLAVNHHGMHRDMLRYGGFGAFPLFAVKDAISSGELVRILPKWTLGPIEVFALYTARRPALSVARDFVDVISDHFRRT